MCGRFEFTIQWGYGTTKISVSKITVVIEDLKKEKNILKIYSATVCGIKLGMVTQRNNTYSSAEKSHFWAPPHFGT